MQDNSAVEKLLWAFRSFRKAGWHDRTIAGCKPSEIGVLLTIKHHSNGENEMKVSEMKVSEISKLLRVTSPMVTQLIKGLEASGLIERHIDSNDRRAVGISLTEKGINVVLEAEDVFVASFQGLIDYLGEERSNQLAELLTEASCYFEKEAHER